VGFFNSIQFIGSKTRQSNMCNKTNRAGQQDPEKVQIKLL